MKGRILRICPLTFFGELARRPPGITLKHLGMLAGGALRVITLKHLGMLAEGALRHNKNCAAAPICEKNASRGRRNRLRIEDLREILIFF